MASYLLLALPLALVWVGITSRATLASLLIGYVLSLGALALLRPRPFRARWARLPRQLLALVIYVAALFRDILLSGVDVARRVLSPDMRLKPGIVAVPTQDPEANLTVAALSADSITLTPGELVVEIENNQVMYVHCLDVEASAAEFDRVQARRLALLRRIIGREA